MLISKDKKKKWKDKLTWLVTLRWKRLSGLNKDED